MKKETIAFDRLLFGRLALKSLNDYLTEVVVIIIVVIYGYDFVNG